MRKVIADTLDMDISAVNVKATTEEGLGFTGSGEGISAQAVCLLTSPIGVGTRDVMENEKSAGTSCGCGACPIYGKQNGNNQTYQK